MKSKYKKTTEDFILEAVSKYGNRFDYSRVNYTGAHKKVIIGCSIHGDFDQAASAHIRSNTKHPCKECFLDSLRNTTEDFVKKAREVHGTLYDYQPVTYKNNHSKVTIACCLHGEFLITPATHLRGQGCSKCRLVSFGEMKIREWLVANGLVFQQQKTFPDLVNPKTKYPLRLDFYLEDQNCAIEFDGIQHDGPFDFRSKTRDSEIAELNYKNLKLRDSLKEAYLIDKDIKLIRIKYKDRLKISSILEEKLKA